MQAFVETLLALVAFALLHSLMVLVRFKALFAALVGPRPYLGLYRLVYNAVSVLTFAPVLLVMAANPGPVVWDVSGLVRDLLSAIQLANLGLLIVAALQVDVWRFAGLRQAWAYLNGAPLPLPAEPLQTGGLYGLVRHPLYLFSMGFLWANPTMRASSLALAAGASVYFILGAWVEERRFLRQIGAQYRAYQCRVPFMIPLLRLPDARCQERVSLPDVS